MNTQNSEPLTTVRKALTINFDSSKYGTFAEIGAGQEVARQFFQVGGAAGTIAKSMSAYDMTFSNEIYGKARRYVSKERLLSILDHEYALLKDRLWDSRAERSQFFVFGNTVSARNYKGTNECHGWMGIRVQLTPQADPDDCYLHVRMLDHSNQLQQEALGIIGVNLIYGAFYYFEDADKLLESLADSVGAERIEIDMIECHGPSSKGIDNRLLSLSLVTLGYTNAVMFGRNHTVLQPSESLYKKALLVERGSFRPVSHVNIDMLQCARVQFLQDQRVKSNRVRVLLEITMRNLLTHGEGSIDRMDLLARIDVITALGYTVLISNYFRYYRLSEYLRQYTHAPIGLVMGINHVLEIFNEAYYSDLPGGILEAMGRLFKENIRLYVYPMTAQAFRRHLAERAVPTKDAGSVFTSKGIITDKNLKVPAHLKNLYAYLRENHYLESVTGYNRKVMGIFSRDCVNLIAEGDPNWEEMLPDKVVAIVKRRRLWGYKPD